MINTDRMVTHNLGIDDEYPSVPLDSTPTS